MEAGGALSDHRECMAKAVRVEARQADGLECLPEDAPDWSCVAPVFACQTDDSELLIGTPLEHERPPDARVGERLRLRCALAGAELDLGQVEDGGHGDAHKTSAARTNISSGPQRQSGLDPSAQRDRAEA
jgi:hypothetical protein